jgi:hypothetical protein
MRLSLHEYFGIGRTVEKLGDYDFIQAILSTLFYCDISVIRLSLHEQVFII